MARYLASDVLMGYPLRHTERMITAFGVTALTFMMVMYALERRSQHFILAFALGCILSSVYGFLAGTWPFGVVELIWAFVAVRRYQSLSRRVFPTAG